MNDSVIFDDRVSNDSADSFEPGQLVAHFFRHEYSQLVASLTRRFGVRYWELVEDVVQSALQQALSVWPRRGIPPNPSAWLHRVAANLAIDYLRRDRRITCLPDKAIEFMYGNRAAADPAELNDDMLRMIFVCCDPDVPPESQIALALKTLCGFGNREISRALLTTEASVAKRVTRARKCLRESGVEPGEMCGDALVQRLSHVEAVIYLLFNEGYSSSLSDRVIREDLCEEAVRLALLLAEHPGTCGGETAALLALLLFHASRLNARLDSSGAILLLREQDRTLWDPGLMREAYHWLGKSIRDPGVSRYHAEALIAAEHCRAESVETTDWDRIIKAYDLLCALAPSPVHSLNRAIAIGHHRGPQAGLQAFVGIDSQSLERDYYLWHVARADLERQVGNTAEARAAFQRAWELAPTSAEKELICRKLEQLGRVNVIPSFVTVQLCSADTHCRSYVAHRALAIQSMPRVFLFRSASLTWHSA